MKARQLPILVGAVTSLYCTINVSLPTSRNKFAPGHSVLVSTFRASQCEGSSKESYDKLAEKLREIDTLSGIMQILDWDEMVYLPPNSADSRNAQKSLLSKLIYERKTSNDLKVLVEKAHASNEKESSLYSEREKANIRDAKRDIDLNARKTEAMAVRETELESVGYQTWVESKKQKDFKKFESTLKEIIKLKTEISRATHPDAVSPYDGCVDNFERGMTSARLTQIFSVVESGLFPLIQAIAESAESRNYEPPAALRGDHPAWSDLTRQKALCRAVAEKIGFDFTSGRLDESVHPFTGGYGPADVRITSRYSGSDWLEGLAGVVHEVLHCLPSLPFIPSFPSFLPLSPVHPRLVTVSTNKVAARPQTAPACPSPAPFQWVCTSPSPSSGSAWSSNPFPSGNGPLLSSTSTSLTPRTSPPKISIDSSIPSSRG